MVEAILLQVLLGIYLGVLTGIIPALIAWTLAFIFKYVTDVTVPGFGVVVLGAALAGISGGLMGLLDPAIADSWVGITALLVVLMMTLWAHNKGDQLGATFPRRITLAAIRERTLSTDVVERVGGFGQVRVRIVGPVEDIDGYPPLSPSVRADLRNGSWTFPAVLTIPELEERLAERLASEYDLADVSVSVNAKGQATVAGAPAPGGLSRSVPTGTRAVSVSTLIPTGTARGDEVSISLPGGEVTGSVVSVFQGNSTTKEEEPNPRPSAAEGGETDEPVDLDTPLEVGTPLEGTRVRTSGGGEERLTVALSPRAATRLLAVESVPVTVLARGKRREYELVTLLKQAGVGFRTVTVPGESVLDGIRLADAQLRDTYGVAVFAIRRGKERIIAPDGATGLASGDELIVAGPAAALSAFTEAIR